MLSSPSNVVSKSATRDGSQEAHRAAPQLEADAREHARSRCAALALPRPDQGESLRSAAPGFLVLTSVCSSVVKHRKPPRSVHLEYLEDRESLQHVYPWIFPQAGYPVRSPSRQRSIVGPQHREGTAADRLTCVRSSISGCTWMRSPRAQRKRTSPMRCVFRWAQRPTCA